jgi:hypothetical protein
MNRVRQLLGNTTFIAGLLGLLAAVFSAQSFLLGMKTFEPGGLLYTHYNNYIIFRQSFHHLIDYKDLYILYPAEQWDLFKYSPTFALFFGLFAAMPDWLGLFCWNLLNVLVLFYGIWLFPAFTMRSRWIMLALVLIEMITSIQSAQSNALIAGLILIAFTMMEKRNLALAGLCIMLTVFIKIFGIVALCLFLFYPGKIKAAAWTLLWAVLVAALPLLVVSPEQLTILYKSWLHLLLNDHSVSVGFSVAGWLYTWFGIDLKNSVLLAGAVLLLVPLARVKAWMHADFRKLFLASVLIWVVIFNHKAESPTFIIAMCGVAIWYLTQAPTRLNNVLLFSAVVLTVLSPTDLFPRSLREELIVPYVLKAVPCMLIWCKLTYELCTLRVDERIVPETHL